MKIYAFILFSLLFFGSCSKSAYVFTSFHEPANEGLRMLYSMDGYKWTDFNRVFMKPEIGEQKIMRDPSMAQGPDGTYHLVWTTGWRGTKGFGYSSSVDLVNWSAQQSIEVMKNEPTTVNVWAPEVFYDNETSQFIIIWASTIPFRYPKGEEEENNNHRMYYVTTKDFKSFSDTKLFMDPGFSVIDAVIVKMNKGKYALVLKDNTRKNRNMKIAFAEHAIGPYTGASAAFTDNLTEGPSVVKVKDKWLVYYDAYGEKKYLAKATKDFKSFQDVRAEVQLPEGHKHGTIVKVPERLIRNILNK